MSAANPETVRDLHDRFLQALRDYGAGEAVQALWRAPGSGAAGGSWARDYLDR